MSLRKFGRARCGASGVEFALVMPILLFLMMGAIEIGRALHDYQLMNESVRDAARFLGRVPVTCPGGGAAGIIGGADLAAAKSLATTGNPVLSAAPSLLSYWSNGDITATVTCISKGPVGLEDFQGLYNDVIRFPEDVPVIEVVAAVAFPYLFGTFIAPDGTPTFTIRHKVVNTGQ